MKVNLRKARRKETPDDAINLEARNKKCNGQPNYKLRDKQEKRDEVAPRQRARGAKSVKN